MAPALFQVVSILTVALVVLCGVYALGRGGAAILATAYAFIASCLISITPAVHAALMAIVVLVCALRREPTKRFAVVATIATVVFIGISSLRMALLSRELDDLTARYPIVSLSSRLAYEQDVPLEDKLDPSKSWSDQPPPPGVDFEHLKTLENLHDAPPPPPNRPERRQLWYRRASLASLERAHESRVDEFMDAEGFGVVRGRGLGARKEYIDIPDTEPIPLQCERPRESSPQSSAPDVAPTVGEGLSLSSEGKDGAIGGLPALDELIAQHRNSAVDFSNLEGRGHVGHEPGGSRYQLSLDRVIGFQPHAFRRMPEFPATGSTRWRIQELQLVSLLKHRPAVAYVSENLPRMEELVVGKTRALDDFETASLERLRAGEELVAERHGSQIRMLGSIRAIRQCLDCHHVRRGTLLGAFTYRLQPAP